MSGSGVAGGRTILSRFEGFVALNLQLMFGLVVRLQSNGGGSNLVGGQFGRGVEFHYMQHFVSLDCEMII